ncbi:DUF397 domain-containing protein [Streptomyces sp. NPDC127084]|uniref:DUF397 domain-containing protein n=1 Tax=Streptomyces sp. NPDC127084 TaxID=3347133 RepID=UPI003662BBCD
MTRTTSHADLPWRKSSYSGNSDSQCVEVAPIATMGLDGVAIRDSKCPVGPMLTLGSKTFATFIASVSRPTD